MRDHGEVICRDNREFLRIERIDVKFVAVT